MIANKDFPASFKWSFFLPYNFWFYVFELSIKSSLFVFQKCLIISFPRFTFTLILLLSWCRMTIFVDGDSSVTNSRILPKLVWSLEQSSFVMSFVLMCIAITSGFCLRVGRMWSTRLQISLLHKVLFGIYIYILCLIK